MFARRGLSFYVWLILCQFIIFVQSFSIKSKLWELINFLTRF